MDTETSHSPLSHFDATGLIDSLALPVLVLDAEGCVVFANASACRLLSVSLREWRGQPVDLLFAEGHRLRSTLAGIVRGEAAPVSSRPMRLAATELARPDRRLALKVSIFHDEYSGPHLLVQLARLRSVRRRPVLSLVPSLTGDRPAELPKVEYA